MRALEPMGAADAGAGAGAAGGGATVDVVVMAAVVVAPAMYTPADLKAVVTVVAAKG